MWTLWQTNAASTLWTGRILFWGGDGWNIKIFNKFLIRECNRQSHGARPRSESQQQDVKRDLYTWLKCFFILYEFEHAALSCGTLYDSDVNVYIWVSTMKIIFKKKKTHKQIHVVLEVQYYIKVRCLMTSWCVQLGMAVTACRVSVQLIPFFIPLRITEPSPR